MAAIQLSFTLRTSSNVKTVHLIGSWDNYSGQLPLSMDSSKSGGWRGTFRFQGSTLQAGQRYWYYYIMDGYHVSHDPAQPSTKEPTTGRSLNILDVKATSTSSVSTSTTIKPRSSNPSRYSTEIPKGRSVSPSKIISPQPSKPYASRHVREADYSHSPGIDSLTSQLESASLYHYGNRSPASSIGSGSTFSSSGRSSGGTSPSSLSSLSDPNSSGSECRCNRYGVTRSGQRVKLDCGGSKCGYSDDSSSACSSIESGSESESEVQRPRYRQAPPQVKYQEIKPRETRREPVRSSAQRSSRRW